MLVHKNPPNSSKQQKTHMIIAKLLITNSVFLFKSLRLPEVVQLRVFWTFQINDFVLFFFLKFGLHNSNIHTSAPTPTFIYYICCTYVMILIMINYVFTFKFFIYLSFQSKKIPLFIQIIFFVFICSCSTLFH